MRKTLKRVVKAVLGTSLFIGTYIFGLCYVQAISHMRSPRIGTQGQLEEQLSREREKLGINKKILINAKIGGHLDFAKKMGEDEYLIILGDANLSSLKHELYHISDGHCDEEDLTKLNYLFWNEPRATIYQFTGIKP